MYNIVYNKANYLAEIDETLISFYNESQSPKLLEVFTPRTQNDDVLLNYFRALR